MLCLLTILLLKLMQAEGYTSIAFKHSVTVTSPAQFPSADYITLPPPVMEKAKGGGVLLSRS